MSTLSCLSLSRREISYPSEFISAISLLMKSFVQNQMVNTRRGSDQQGQNNQGQNNQGTGIPMPPPLTPVVLLHLTVVRSGLQRHCKVSLHRVVVELPAMAMPPHGASARASLLSKPSRCHRAIRVPAHHRPRTGAISTESRLHTVSPLHVLAITHHTKEQASTASQSPP